MPDQSIEILYTAWNRLEFVGQTIGWLVAHTDWRLVSRVIVYDDGSEDGTLEYLREQTVRPWPVPVELRVSDLRSPPAIMNHYLATAEADLFAKVDSDIALPPGWLNRLAGVMDEHPSLEVLGMEAGMCALPGRDGAPEESGPYSIVPCSHIGGVGLMRIGAFRSRARPRIPERGYFGWTEHQQRRNFERAWITPDILCPQLDRIPLEPWSRLADEYADRGWSRRWPAYDETWARPYYEWVLADREQVA